MNISSLSTFLTIIETGSLVSAAEQLHVTQSTVTARLKTLEADLGQTLMLRDKSGIRLTAAGLKLKRYAEVMTQLWQQARQETALPRGMNDLCHIGCDPALWESHGKVFLAYLKANHPDLALTFVSAQSRKLLDHMDDGQIDLALCLDTWPRANHDSTNLGQMDLILASSNPDAPLRFDPGYFYIDHGDDFGRAHAEFFADANTARLTFDNAHWGLQHILDHGGTSYFAQTDVEGLLTTGQLYPVKDAPVFHRKISVFQTQTAKADWPWLSDFFETMAKP